MTHDHLITTTGKPRFCPGCGHLLLAGTADGINYDVEAEPINHAGEIDAVLDGRHTYEVITPGHLTARTAQRMQAHTADDAMVLVEHRCNRKIPASRRAHHELDPIRAAIAIIREQMAVTELPPNF